MLGERHNVLAGAIEGGGTKFVCAVGTGPHDLSRAEFSTGDDPARLLAEVVDWLKARQHERGALRAIGIGSFGPLDLRPGSPTYGHITSTPKPGWGNADVAGTIRQAFPDLPVSFETDVNAAAVGEHFWGQACGLTDFVYITVGTGIGAGGMAGGELIHGLVHPEMGHMLLPRVPGDTFAGACPYHGPCWEGLCSGPALLRRSHIPPENLPPEHEAWTLTTQYMAYAVANIVCVLSPERVIIGGGVRKAGRLGENQFFRLIGEKTRAALNGYIASPALCEEIAGYIVPPGLGDDAGVCGALALAQMGFAREGLAARPL